MKRGLTKPCPPRCNFNDDWKSFVYKTELEWVLDVARSSRYLEGVMVLLAKLRFLYLGRLQSVRSERLLFVSIVF
jgi:hypothetical protein